MKTSYYDDFQIGDEYVSAGRTLTETDVVLYSVMSGDYDEKHTNVTVYGEKRPVPQMLVFGISHGLMNRTGMLEGIGGIAFAGVDDIEFLAPLYVGDTVHAVIKVSDLRPSKSKPDRGLVCYSVTMVNQHGVPVQHAVKKLMKYRKPQEGGNGQ